MKSKLIKILILIVTIILLFGNTQVFANAPYENPNFYKPDVNNADNEAIKTKANVILGIISAIGTVCSVIVVSAIGIRYMFGSVEEKAEYKKTAIAYLIGAFLLFSATTLPNMLYNLGQSIGQETGDNSEVGGSEEGGSEEDGSGAGGSGLGGSGPGGSGLRPNVEQVIK